MKILAEWQYQGRRKLRLNKLRTYFCCDRAKRSSAVVFGRVDTLLNKNESVNIFSCDPIPYKPVWYEEPIAFCPFCGTRIRIEIRDKRAGK